MAVQKIQHSVRAINEGNSYEVRFQKADGHNEIVNLTPEQFAKYKALTHELEKGSQSAALSSQVKRFGNVSPMKAKGMGEAEAFAKYIVKTAAINERLAANLLSEIKPSILQLADEAKESRNVKG